MEFCISRTIGQVLSTASGQETWVFALDAVEGFYQGWGCCSVVDRALSQHASVSAIQSPTPHPSKRIRSLQQWLSNAEFRVVVFPLMSLLFEIGDLRLFILL